MSNPLSINELNGTAVPILGNDVDTDRIIPARYLKEITFDKMGEYLFSDVRHDLDGNKTDHPLNETQFQNASVMVVERNFGCGSSREHAPQAIKRAGFKAIIGESFAEIFSGNCKNLGVLTAQLSTDDLVIVVSHINQYPRSDLQINIEASTLTVSGIEKSFIITIKPSHQKAFIEGTWDELALLKLNKTKINSVVKKLPYFTW